MTSPHLPSIRWCGGMGQGKSVALRTAVEEAVRQGTCPVSFLPTLTDVGLRTERVDLPRNDATIALGAAELQNRLVRNLSSGERQRARLASALGNRFELVALDEPCRHLDPDHIEALNGVLTRRKAEGLTVLACDMRGAITPRAFDEDRGVVRKQKPPPVAPPEPNGPALTIEVGTPFVLSATGRSTGKLVLEVSQGSLVIVQGPNGGGKTSLLEALGKKARAGGRKIGYSRQEPEHQVFAPSPAAELEEVVAAQGRAPEWLVRPDGGRATLLDLAGMLGLTEWLPRATSRLPLGVLSQLGVAIALWMGHDLVLLDEPTQGLDAAGARALSTLLADLAGRGARIVAASHDPELMAVGNVRWNVQEGILQTGGRS